MDDNDPGSRIALALDVPTLDSAKALIDRTREHIGTFKVGLELYTAVGPAAVEAVHAAGAKCFLDLKLHDIPATMGRSVARAACMGVAYLTVHGLAGLDSLRQASDNAGSARLLAVTVLTSLDEAALQAIGLSGGPQSAADRLAKLAWDAGVRGFVTSAHECAALREALGPDAFLVTPGIRPAGSDVGDQKRVMTPRDAIKAGADLLVVGRPIRDANNPTEAAAEIARQVQLALSP
ncbi:MAG: orotidine-5'-phosphate decarboxylase [Deltaproteobacteria bacterium]|jgi:orotidine-5'-phosphate decarboxylase|nr:orotidine-5'-phosphate decarboxylase [Deltaproteobacteria bacterium]MBW2188457.1 orotidine-5'-phosphate decarboxylase [Deltaproteobacteria bacterium]MBW2224012.1 orotidine-5'-phosphate decarboxylase [Deltaproteobacteria bacterium]MBW2404062.1 orotidine-5'-phosphate decarboxylase [Deltaproteobacteria bacterium]MBW2546087.1 orotidine-5'-phosphate decarboxylase [Deltaproteobacteria bacterium]